MRINKLKAVVCQLMFAGCVSVSISTPTFAANLFNGKYSYSAFHQAYPEYRFRPVEQKPADYRRYQPNARYSYLRQQRPVSGSYRTTAGFYPGYARQQRPLRTLTYQPARSVPAYNHFTRTLPASHYQKPAFARQYAWEAAQPRGFRRGGGANYYSNQSNDSVEQSGTSIYRTSPVTAHGYQYRSPARNANFVTFSERVMKSFKPVRQERFSRNNQVQEHARPAERLGGHDQARQAYKSGHATGNLGNYRFRPDTRFQPAARQTRAQDIAPAAVPVSYRLADAEFPKTGNNPWDQWSFRPVDSTF